jgi:hypothetical protein
MRVRSRVAQRSAPASDIEGPLPPRLAALVTWCWLVSTAESSGCSTFRATAAPVVLAV